MSAVIMDLNNNQPKGGNNKNNELDFLISEIALGKTDALEKFYIQTKTAVYGFALSIVKNPQTAEDIMQDTYIKIYASSGSYRTQGKPMAWILTIVKNLALTGLRNMSENNLSLKDEWTSAINSFTESSMDRILLNKVLESLSDVECRIVILHSITGLKHREISELLDIPLSTTLSKYRRSLSKLKKLLKEDMGIERK